MGVGEGAVVLPQWIDLHVAHDDGLAGEGGRPARSRARPDLQPVHRGVVTGRQVRRGAVPQPLPITVDQEDRAQHAGGGALDERYDAFEDFRERGASRDALQHMSLPAERGDLRRGERRGSFGHWGQR